MKVIGLVIAGVLGVLVVLSLLVTVSERSRPDRGRSPEDTKRRAELAAFVQQTLAEGVVTKFSCTGNEAQVNPVAWAVFDADAKRGLTRSLARHCDDQSSGDRITIIDAQSGRTLATFHGGRYTVH